MENKGLKTTWRGAKFVGRSFNPVNWVTPFFRYNPTGKTGFTKEALNGISLKRIFNKKANKELYETLMSVKSKTTFEKSMQVEGLTEEDLKKGHSRYQIYMMALIVIPIWPIYHLFNLMNDIFAGGFSYLPFISSFFTILAPLLFCLFFYLYYAWLALRVRNRRLITPKQFFTLCKNDITNLSPVEDYETKLVDKEKTVKIMKKGKVESKK